MANYRQVHTKIWKDNWFLDLQPSHKLFFIYLFTNEMASISGIYELPQRVMSFESGLTPSEIQEAFKEYERAQKAFYENGVVWVVNLRKYHETNSPKVQTRINKDVNAVKTCPLKKRYCESYGIDTVSEVADRVFIPPSMSTIKSSLEEGSKKKNGYW